ncbi:MAG: tolB protein precursor, periplasmic protein involved in the tonb-independent uptake of group A colicins [uncultured Sulfurovum sp.]|uniref:TolB protein, periplasmic protein involved in the tonb-independent uptake of group A colicins n=1 Tax=uncultured Sulfurovum sp. TaxID=269237 RepID=A0A6S6U7V2_9BACT|nr:MAG: tolB protein precursor, periplasmic protein involved in the tonb-independent uptake of group A colicins [uncultured Sulfurovum sp.]
MRYILFFLLTLNLHSFDAVLDIEKDVETKATLSVMEDSSTAGSTVTHSKMFNVLLNDLKISGHFTVDTQLRRGGFDDALIPVELHSREYLLKYKYGASGTTLSVKLIRVADSLMVFQNNYSVNAMARYPFLAHNAVVELNKVLGFEDISWMKRNILFSKYTGSRKSEIWIADYTLNFSSVILRGGLNLFPKWANPAQSAFYYTSYNLDIPTLYKVDMNSGSRRKVIASEGMLVASDVSQDGSRVLLTMAPHGQTDIYEFSVASNSTNRLTNFSGIDVNGKYIGDESQIAFVSNRVGRANIYTKAIGSRSVSRAARYGNNNDSCDAFGQHILYSVKEGGSSNIYLGSVSSSYVRPLTSNGRNLLPRFSADGKVILYIKQNGGRNSIGYMNLATKQSALFSMKSGKIQSIDW